MLRVSRANPQPVEPSQLGANRSSMVSVEVHPRRTYAALCTAAALLSIFLLVQGDPRIHLVQPGIGSQTWQLRCEHRLADLERRVPLHWLVTRARTAGPTAYPCFWPRPSCQLAWHGSRDEQHPRCRLSSCFRAVHDGFLRANETRAAAALFDSLALRRREDANAPQPAGAAASAAAGVDGLTARLGLVWGGRRAPDMPSEAGEPAAAELVAAVHERMAQLLVARHGATAPYVVSSSVTLEEQTVAHGSAAEEQASVQRQALFRGDFSPATAAQVDAAYMPEWLYTCVLYVRVDGVAGGETLFIDEVAAGRVSRGLLAVPAEGRLLAFTSHAENVRVGVGPLSGRLVLWQAWFGALAR